MPLPGPARVGLALLASSVTLAAAVPPASADGPRPRPTRAELALLDAVNYARTVRGLRPVRLGSSLQRRAHAYARKLIRTDRWAHASLPYGVGENLAMGPARTMGARAVVRRWLRSPPHRYVLLWPPARSAGFGVARGRFWGYAGVQISVARVRR
jgi:uncharacterized protein YkwD